MQATESGWQDSVRQLEQVRRTFGGTIDQNHPAIHAWVMYRSKSKRLGLEFTLDRVEFTDFVTDHCFYCGVAPKPIHTVDRVDNTKGYVRGNVVTACAQCNIAKNDYSFADFREWAIRVGANLFKWYTH